MVDAHSSGLAFLPGPGYVLRARQIRQARGPDGQGRAAFVAVVTGKHGERRQK